MRLAEPRGLAVHTAVISLPLCQVYLRRLDPNYRYNPRGDHSLAAWAPKTISISCHRLGLTHLSCGSHLFVTGGGSGSVKMWPEVTLRSHATEAGIHLPKSKNILAEELGNMLNFATASGSSSNTSQVPSRAGSAFLPVHHSNRHSSSTLQPATTAAVAGAYEAHMERALSGASGVSGSGGGVLNGGFRVQGTPERLHTSTSSSSGVTSHQEQQQQTTTKHKRSRSSGAALPPLGPEEEEEEDEQPTSRAASEGRGVPALHQQESHKRLGGTLQEQQQQQLDRRDRTNEAGPSDRAGANGSDALSRWQQINALRRQSSSSWPRSMQHQGWMLEYGQIAIKRSIGEGSYGRVSLGTLHETDVAVKVRGAVGLLEMRGYVHCGITGRCSFKAFIRMGSDLGMCSRQAASFRQNVAAKIHCMLVSWRRVGDCSPDLSFCYPPAPFQDLYGDPCRVVLALNNFDPLAGLGRPPSSRRHIG
jgi:hypothetical protein